MLSFFWEGDLFVQCKQNKHIAVFKEILSSLTCAKQWKLFNYVKALEEGSWCWYCATP